ncbi:MAG: type III secretion system export apparatus subunit SctS [Chlamydiota bacterium]
MFQTHVVKMAFEGLLMILILSGPPVLIGMFFGLTVAIFQTATQIQEQTLSIAVKLVAVTLTLVFLGSWLGTTIWQFAMTIFENFPRWIEL